MRYYQTVADLVERALRGEDVEWLLGQLGIAFDRLPSKNPSSLLRSKFKTQTETALYKRHKIAPYIIAPLYDLLRDERDQRIQSSTILTEMRRDEARNTSMRRFAGWASSTPTKLNKREVINFIVKPVKELPKHEKDIIQDQSRKMVSNMDQIVASSAGAIGYYWHSMFRMPNYNYRIEHKHNDVHGIFVILKDSWAYKQGLVKKGNQIFQSEIEKPGELPNCKCSARYVYDMSDIPKDCLTIKGLEFTKAI